MYFFKKNNSKDIKVFFVYTLLLFTSIIAVLTFRYFLKSYQTYLIFYRCFIILEFALISLYFAKNITQVKIRIFIRLLIVPFSTYSVYDYITSINQDFTYYPLVLECLLFPIIIILFFHEKIKYSTKYPIYLSSGFWIAVGFLIFSTGNFFLFLFSKILLQNLDNKNMYNIIYGFFTILKNIFLCVAVIVSKNSKITVDSSNISINLELEAFTSFNNNTNMETHK